MNAASPRPTQPQFRTPRLDHHNHTLRVLFGKSRANAFHRRERVRVRDPRAGSSRTSAATTPSPTTAPSRTPSATSCTPSFWCPTSAGSDPTPCTTPARTISPRGRRTCLTSRQGDEYRSTHEIAARQPKEQRVVPRRLEPVSAFDPTSDPIKTHLKRRSMT